MQPMSVEESFRRLDLPLDANEKTVRSAFNQRAKRVHPDRAVGSSHEGDANLEMAHLIEAKRVALGHCKNSKALVKVDAQVAIAKLEQLTAALKAKEETRTVAERIRRRRVDTLKGLQFYSWLASGVSAGFALFADKLLLPFLSSRNATGQTDSLVPILQSIVGPVAVVLGVVGAVFHVLAKRLEMQVESFLVELSEPAACAECLTALLPPDDIQQVSLEVLLGGGQDTNNWTTAGIQFSLSYEDRARLIVRKAVEQGLLQEVKPERVTPSYAIQYRLTEAFSPRDFYPKPQSGIDFKASTKP